MDSITGDGLGGSSMTEEGLAALIYAELFTLKCQGGFLVIPLTTGEDIAVSIRLVCSLVVISVASAWVSRRKEIGSRLLLFFWHWLSGAIIFLVLMIDEAMIAVCWTGENVLGFVKFAQFVGLTATNMLATTNLAMCINLAQIVMSQRTGAYITRKTNSTLVVLICLVVSLAAASTSVPFWETMVITPVKFWPANTSKAARRWIAITIFYVEFFIGFCMLIIITWLLLFWRVEIKECWKSLIRIRYYFALTLLGTAANLTIGVIGSMHASGDLDDYSLVTLSWAFRFVHMAADTMVLYGVLVTKYIDADRGSRSSSSRGSEPRPRHSSNRTRKGERVQPDSTQTSV